MSCDIKTKVGIIGGGQLGRMMALSAPHLGITCSTLIDKPKLPITDCINSSNVYLYSTDKDDAIRDFADACDVAIVESESIDIGVLNVVMQHTKLAPCIDSIAICQNRMCEKQFLEKYHFPVLKFKICNSLDDIRSIEFPIVIKSLELGYDGKKQIKLLRPNLITDDCIKDAQIPFPLIAEEFIHDLKEASVLIASNQSETCVYPCVDNTHNNGILEFTQFPSRLPITLQDSMQEIAHSIARKMEYIGVLCVEFFIRDNQIFVNEMAPRPHNSGHWTMDFARTSQFEQSIRCAIGMPIGDTRPTVKSAKMINLLGISRGDSYSKYLNKNSKFYWYNKGEPYGRRKMGHINILLEQER